MTELLVRTFVKDYEQVETPLVRTRYGLMASIVGICCNLVLFAAKLLTGIMMHSISVMADAFNNLSDAASSIVGFVGMKMAQKPADEAHPFGHGRIEYISAFIVAFFVIQVGFSLFKTSAGKILHPEELAFHPVSVGILAMSVAVKLWMALFNRKLGKRIHSSVMMATSADSLGDVGATAATIVSILVFGIWGINIDGLVGLVVSVLVMIAGVNIAKDTLAPLIGEPIDPKLYRQIKDFVESYDGIIGSHDLIVHDYGPNRSMASIHVELPSHLNVGKSHAVVDRIEREAMEKLGVFLVIHMDPVDVHNRRSQEKKQMVIDILKGLDERLTIHDFRAVRSGKRTDLLFDLVVPHEYTEQMQRELSHQISLRVKEQDENCYCTITMECAFCAEE